MIRRCASKMRCQTIALAMPVSSSSVMKVTLPSPGRWRTRTMPATWTFAPSFSAGERGAGSDAAPVELGAQEGERMGAQRELDGAIILDHLAALGHRRQRAPRARCPRASAAANSGSGALAEPAHPPQRLAPVEAERMEGVGVGELLQRRRRHARAAPDILDRGEGRVHRRRRDQRAMIVGRGPSPCAGRGGAGGSRLALPSQGRIWASKRAIPAAGVDADRAHLDAMLARVADELGGRRRSPSAGR